MRQHTIGDWFFRLTFTLPMAAAVTLMGILGLLGIAELVGGSVLSGAAWKLFLGLAAGLVGLVILFRMAVVAAALVGSIALTVHTAARAAGPLLRASMRDM